MPDLARRIEAAIRADSERWHLSPVVAWVLIILPAVGAIAIALAAPHPRLYHFLIDEDHVIEWTQFFTILAASIVFAITAWTAWRQGRRGLAVLFALVAVGSFVVAGEEISWGQRLIGFATPNALQDVNHQGESNVHNILPLQRAFNIGELVVGLIGFVLPFLWLYPRFRTALAARIDPIVVPPLATVTLFFLPFAYRAFRAVFLPEAGERITEFGEWPELTLYLGILVCGWLILAALRREQAAATA